MCSIALFFSHTLNRHLQWARPFVRDRDRTEATNPFPSFSKPKGALVGTVYAGQAGTPAALLWSEPQELDRPGTVPKQLELKGKCRATLPQEQLESPPCAVPRDKLQTGPLEFRVEWGKGCL